MRNKLQKSFYSSLIIVVICIIGAVLLAFAHISKVKSNLNIELARLLTEISEQGSSNVSSKIEADLKALETMALFAGRHENLTDDMLLNSLKDVLAVNLKFKHMSIILPDRRIFRTDGENGVLVWREYFNKALAGEPNVAGPLEDIFSGTEIYVYGVPIYNRQNTIMGVLSAAVDRKEFAEMLTVPVFNDQGFAYLVSAGGDITADYKYAANANAVSNILMLNYSNLGLKQKIRSDLGLGHAGVAEYYSKGQKLYISYAPVKVTDWNIVTVVPHSVIGKPAENIIKSVTYFWIGVIAAFTGLLILILVLHFKRVKNLERYMYLDDLTGINNWKKFDKDARKLLADSHHMNYALLTLGSDKLKTLRDLYGNAYADTILKKLADIIQSHTGKYEICGRYMADVFVMLILYKNDAGISERIRKIISDANQKIPEPSVALSAGIYQIHDTALPVITMTDYALMSKDKVKDNFGSAYYFFDQEMHAMLTLEKKCESLMEESLANNHFMVYFQPKYHLRAKKIVGAEALIRWNHPETGFLAPKIFIPIFEKNGFIVNLDLFVFESVCKILRDWLKSGLEPIAISVNLSRLHLKDMEITEKLKALVEHYEIPPQLIEIEFTENIMMEYTPILDAIVKRFHEIGFSVAMDDFGEGYSSLGLLQHLHVDVLKIDQGFFVEDINSKRVRIIIANIIRMAKELSMETVSEGIETQEQVSILEELGCDIIQGYVFARPMPAAEFRQFMQKQC